MARSVAGWVREGAMTSARPCRDRGRRRTRGVGGVRLLQVVLGVPGGALWLARRGAGRAGVGGLRVSRGGAASQVRPCPVQRELAHQLREAGFHVLNFRKGQQENKVRCDR